MQLFQTVLSPSLLGGRLLGLQVGLLGIGLGGCGLRRVRNAHRGGAGCARAAAIHEAAILGIRLAAAVNAVIGEISARHAADHGRACAGTDLHDAGGQLFDEVTVVGDRHDGALEGLQRGLQRLAGVNIQVVGGLVQHEQIHFRQDQLAEGQPRPLAAREDADGLEHRVPDEAELSEGTPHLGLGHAGVGVPQLVQHGLGGVKVLVLLIVVADLHVIPRLDDAREGLQLAHHQLDEGGFAASVPPEDEQTVVPLDQKIQVGKKNSVSKAHGDVPHVQHVVAAGAGGGKLHFNRLGRRLGALQLDHFIQELLSALGRDDVPLAVPRPLLRDIRLLPRDLLLLVAVVLLLDGAVDLPLLHGFGIPATVELGAVVLDAESLIGHSVQEITVVGDDHDASLVVREKSLQPREGVNIQVVGGLVEQEDIGLAGELDAKSEAGLLAAA